MGTRKTIIYFQLLLYVYRFSLTRRWKVNVEYVNSVFLFQILNIDVQFIYFLNGLVLFLCFLEIKTVVQVFFEDFNSSVKWSDPGNFLKARFVIFRCQKYPKKGTWKWQKKFTLRLGVLGRSILHYSGEVSPCQKDLKSPIITKVQENVADCVEVHEEKLKDL